jgi:hypothetical protein
MASLCRHGLARREGDRFVLTDEAAVLCMPRTVWAGKVTRKGVEWREAEVIRVTVARATLRLDGIAATVSMKTLFGTGALAAGTPATRSPTTATRATCCCRCSMTAPPK